MQEKTTLHPQGNRSRVQTPLLFRISIIVFLCSLILCFAHPALANVVVGGIDLTFIKPKTESYSLVTISGTQKGGKLAGQSGNIEYYRVNTRHYPVVAVKQSTYVVIWKSTGVWTEAEKQAVLKALIAVDPSIGSSSVAGWYTGTEFNTAQASSSQYKNSNYGNYYYDPSDGYFYIQKDKLSHIDWGEDPNYALNQTGTLTVKKSFAGNDPELLAKWGVSNANLYQAVVNSDQGYLTLSGDFPNYTYKNTVQNKNQASVISFSAASPAKILNIPTGWLCTAEESEAPFYAASSSKPSGIAIVPQSGAAPEAEITITNTYIPYEYGSLVISKALADDAGGMFLDGWGVDESTVFEAKVWDRTGGRRDFYLIFEQAVNPGSNEYICVGNNTSLSKEGYTGKTQLQILDLVKEGGFTDKLPFSVDAPVTALNLWAFDNEYEVEEIGANNCTTYYTYEGGSLYAALAGGSDGAVEVTNTYGDPDDAGNCLVIKKALAGNFNGRADESTVFSATVRDRDGNTLWFYDDGGGNYRFYGTSQGLGQETTVSLCFSVDMPARLEGLPAGDAQYTVEELSNPAYSVHYDGNGQDFPAIGDFAITVINTYIADPNIVNLGFGSLVVQKVLAGEFLDETAPFTARIKTSEGDYLEFSEAAPYQYQYEGIGSAGGLLTFSKTRAAILKGIPEGIVCEVEETGGLSYKANYNPANAAIESGKATTITVTNFTPDSLILKKIVSGNNASQTKRFSFNVQFSDSVIYNGEEFEQGTITLNHGQIVSFEKVSPGTGYTITETDYSSEGYASDQEDNTAKGTKIGAQPLEITFTNYYTAPSGPPNEDNGDPLRPTTKLPVVEEKKEEEKDPEPDGESDIEPEKEPADTRIGSREAPPVYTPGGSDPSEAPNPTVPGRTLVPSEEGGFIELSEDGVPLGEWTWDDGEEEWVFEEYPPPLAALPATGENRLFPVYILVTAGFCLAFAACAACKKIRR